MRTPLKTATRQVAFFLPRVRQMDDPLEQMRQRIDSPQGREMITRRFATVEPVFGNLRHNKRLDRFTLRGRERVDGQWKLYCLTHNIEKLATHGAWR
ncbi:Transposase DDE domain-containing protein [Geopseudomonas sagittaria]|uniref:Transposase DDE domain-containing protein n=1 Tax=Geopseudomonas sagittaria TaxID=1135990 RepID=A0A1I5YJC6_9GAMM|nr:Transposase DDE domain-containing protein [Pseudomonas sagittaria]